MTLSSRRHEAVLSGTSIIVEHRADQHTSEESPREWTLAFDGEVVDSVSTEADCVLTGTLPKHKGDIRAIVHQHMDGTVRINILHDGESLVVYNDAEEVG